MSTSKVGIKHKPLSMSERLKIIYKVDDIPKYLTPKSIEN
jgi:hypothetical protein